MKQNKKYIILSIMAFVIIMTTNIIISLNIYDNYNKKETIKERDIKREIERNFKYK